jgi:CheY-like chemotaxis protein
MEGNATILIVEDDENDVLILKSALKRAGVEQAIQVVGNGREAIDYLCANGPYADRTKFPFPKAIFTDLKMPVMGGFEVLEWLRKHPECSVVPVIILSASKLDADVKHAYQMGANAYLVKPGSIKDLEQMVKTAFDFWRWCQVPIVPQKC